MAKQGQGLLLVGGAAADDNFLYGVYHVEERWIQLVPGANNYTYIGKIDPVITTGHGPGNCTIGSGQTWYWIGGGSLLVATGLVIYLIDNGPIEKLPGPPSLPNNK